MPGGGTAGRKRDHLRLALSGDVGFDKVTTGLDGIRIAARALPGRDLDEVDLGTSFLGHRISAPLLVSCMTGGVSEAGAVNRALAVACQHHGIPMGLGSGRVALEDPAALESFRVRDVAPDVVLLANLGAVQLVSYEPTACARLVAACEADALVLHLNAVQEAVQPGGDTRFRDLVRRIAAVCADLDVPVLVKEVGFGMAPDDVDVLLFAGVAGIDVAGAGGTNWARLEGARSDRAGAVAAAFVDWGWSTADAVRNARARLDAAGTDVALIASGGIRHGVDALKCLALGADVVGVARGLLPAAADGAEVAKEAVGVLVEQLRVATWAAGAGTPAEVGPHLLQTALNPHGG